MAYDAVIFDHDGVLVEPPDRGLLSDAIREAFAAVGVRQPDGEDVRRLRSGVTVAQLEALGADYDVDPAAFWRARDEAASRAQQAAIRDGATPLYEDFPVVAALDRPKGVVSSNQQATVEFALAHHGVADHFETCYGREPVVEHVARKKPDPYFVHRAMADLDASDPLFVGDSETDVLAARNAGIDSAFVRRPHRTDYELSVEPTYEIGDLHGLRSLLE